MSEENKARSISLHQRFYQQNDYGPIVLAVAKTRDYFLISGPKEKISDFFTILKEKFRSGKSTLLRNDEIQPMSAQRNFPWGHLLYIIIHESLFYY